MSITPILACTLTSWGRLSLYGLSRFPTRPNPLIRTAAPPTPGPALNPGKMGVGRRMDSSGGGPAGLTAEASDACVADDFVLSMLPSPLGVSSSSPNLTATPPPMFSADVSTISLLYRATKACSGMPAMLAAAAATDMDTTYCGAPGTVMQASAILSSTSSVLAVCCPTSTLASSPLISSAAAAKAAASRVCGVSLSGGSSPSARTGGGGAGTGETTVAARRSLPLKTHW